MIIHFTNLYAYAIYIVLKCKKLLLSQIFYYSSPPPWGCFGIKLILIPQLVSFWF
jgi:hypothetical protein